MELYRMFENTPKDDIVNHLQDLQLDPTIFQTELDDNNIVIATLNIIQKINQRLCMKSHKKCINA